MTTVANDESLQMFFDEDFNPESYVDALFSSISGTSDRYSTQTLSNINNKTQELLTHLDYNTNVLLHDLEKKMEQLKKMSSPVGVSDFVLAEGDVGSPGSDTSRLQYYVDSLRNAVETLSIDVETVKRESAPSEIDESLEPGQGDPVDSLIQLKNVKARILDVYHLIQNAQRKVSGPVDSAVSDEEFQKGLSSLHEKLRVKLRDGGEDQRAEILESVKELRSWVPMFQPFARFGPVFVKFVAKLENEF